MPTQHTLVPVGMMGVQTHPNYLQSDLQKIYQGDITYNPEACNAVHAYQDYDQGVTGDKLQRALTQYTNLVQKASQASGGRLTCLVGDLTQKGWPSWFYDGTPPTPNLNRVDQFVRQFIDNINNLGLSNNVLGWYLADEPKYTAGNSTKPSLQEVTNICQTAHTAQTAKGWNKPFYIVFYMNANWAADNNNINFCQWVDPWVNAVTITVGANLAIMIDYYPWVETSQNFKFNQYPAPETRRSPLRRWWKFIHDTNQRYSSNTKVVGVQAVVQAYRDNPPNNPDPPSRMPAHADMHQQIRAVRNFMQESGSKPAGVWLYAWGRGESGTTPENPFYAWNHWTIGERWAEAVQNEIDNQTEGITAAIPASNTAIQAFPTSFPPYDSSTKAGGTWITFHLKDRGKVEFTIKDSGGTERRRLHWEYNYNSVQQKAVNSVKPFTPPWPADQGPGRVNELGATAIFFDGKNNCGNNLQGNYTCRMLLNGAPVGCTLSLTVQ